MCGITGLLGPCSTDDESLSDQVTRMADAIAHRGPDSHGIWVDGRHAIGLGHQRLAIVDLSPQGAQPMVSPSGRYVVAFNGEIYNHLALRNEFGGQPWRGRSDTETLCAAFDRWGVLDSLPRLVGMFAIAVWDCRTLTLTLARDRMGEKPLYWGRLRDGSVVFGSELRALRAHGAWSGDIDRDALAAYMRFGNVPAPHTIHRGIHKLEPGSWVQVQAGRDDQQGRWWSLDDQIVSALGQRDAARHWTDEEATDHLERLLMEAVGGQMLADVPLGAFLSGGVDSSAVVTMMTRCAPGAVRTFCIGFDQPGFDEAEHARAVARHLGTRHTELRVTDQDALAVVPRLPLLYDEPFADSSQIPTALVTAMARREVTVALSGDGGDELFAGYNRYLLADRLWRRLAGVPLPLRRAASHAILSVQASHWTQLGNALQRWRSPRHRHALVGPKLHKFARSVLSATSLDAMHRSLASQWDDPGQLVRLGKEPQTVLDRTDAPTGLDAIDRMCRLDQRLYLPEDILVKVDRAAMAVALETRVPLLDHRVVAFAWQLPGHFKLRGGQGKWLLRQVLYRHVPAALIERPKQGFAVPLQQWLHKPLRDWAEALLDPAALAADDLLDPKPVRRAWSQLLAGDERWSGPVWNVLMWQAWRRTWAA